MTFHYKGEYSDRSQLAQRASKLNICMHKLHRLAVTKKIAVVITNHATSGPDEEFRYSVPKPFGGNILSYASNYIINLAPAGKAPGSISATLTKSPITVHYNIRPLQILIAPFGFHDARNWLADEETTNELD